MEAALEEPLNQRFVLLSESDIPLYPPAVVWLQLTSEQKSRVHSCGDRFVSPPFPCVDPSGVYNVLSQGVCAAQSLKFCRSHASVGTG